MSAESDSAVWGFLTHVDPLSVPFLYALGTVFVGGTLLAVVGSMRISKQIGALEEAFRGSDGLRGHHQPEAYLRNSTREASLLALLELIPSLLVSIGILGTFIGLGVALGGLAPLMSEGSGPTELIGGLRDVLSAVAMKFQVSAWGILSSLVFAAGPKAAVSYLLEERIESATLRMEQACGSEVDVLRQELKEAFAPLIEQFGKLGSQLDALKPSLDAVAEGASTMQASTEKLVPATDAMTEAVVQLGALQGTLEASVREIGPAVGEQLKESLAALEEAGGAVQAAVRSLETGIPTALTASMDKLQEQFGAMLEAMGTQQKAAADQLGEGLDTLRSAAGTIEEAVGGLKTEIPASLSASIAKLQDQFVEMQEHLAEQQKAAAEELQEALRPAVEGSAESVREMKDELMPKMNGIMNDVADALRTYALKLDEMNKQLGRITMEGAKEKDLLSALADDDQDDKDELGGIEDDDQDA